MTRRPLKLDWRELLPGRDEASTPEMEIFTSQTTLGVVAPHAGMADYSHVLVMSTVPLKDLDELSPCIEASSLEVEIVDSQLIGCIDKPLVADHALKGDIRPLLNRAKRKQDMHDEFNTPIQIHQADIRQRNFSSAQQDVGELKVSTKSNNTESHEGKVSNDVGVAFMEELGLIGNGKGKSLDKVGSQMCGRECLEPSSILSSRPQRRSSRLFSKRRITCKDVNFIDWEFEKVNDVILLDDEDLPRQTSNGLCDEWKEVTIYYPSRHDAECVELSHSDLECLNPEQYLSSPIMNFYIQYLQKTDFTTCRPQGGHHIFNTFFYGKLQKAMSHKGDSSQYFLKLRRWWKGVNLFSKSYIFLPIHGSSHWSLVIICIMEKEDDSGPLVLHLDSLGLHSSQHVLHVVSKFLKEEWNCINQNPSADVPFAGHMRQNLPRIEKKKVTVPQQKNEYDCGIFVLYFIQRFLEEAPQRLRKHDLSMFSTKWFKPSEASSLRKIIRELLIEEFKKSKCTAF